jgi:hypothetical protein
MKRFRLILLAALVLALSLGTLYAAFPRPQVETPFTLTTPREVAASSFSSSWYRNGSLWAALDPAYQGMWYAGVNTKILWYRSDNTTFTQRLVVTGMRLDAHAVPMNGTVLYPTYAHYDYQPSSVLFSTDGYWRVTGRVGNLSLMFVVHVYPHSDCQLPGGVCTA